MAFGRKFSEWRDPSLRPIIWCSSCSDACGESIYCWEEVYGAHHLRSVFHNDCRENENTQLRVRKFLRHRARPQHLQRQDITNWYEDTYCEWLSRQVCTAV